MKLGIGFAASLIVAAFSFGHSASAETITFDGVQFPTNYNPYVEKGYQFVNTGSVDPGTAQMGTGGDWSDVDPSPTSATLITAAHTTATLTKVGGGAFDLVSIDFAQYPTTTNHSPFDVTFNYVGGTSSTQSYALSTFPDLETFTFNQKNLLSVSWTPTKDAGNLQFDNVVVNAAAVAATPIPGGLPLFASALGVLGFGAWRRRAA